MNVPDQRMKPAKKEWFRVWSLDKNGPTTRAVAKAKFRTVHRWRPAETWQHSHWSPYFQRTLNSDEPGNPALTDGFAF
jgi:hypothetical protein